MLKDIVELKRLKGDMACFEINEQSCIFIGCWRNNINADYLNGLCKYFGFSSRPDFG